LLIPNLLNAYYTALADAISLLLTERSYQLLLSSTRDDPAIEHETLRKLIGHDVDGLLWVPASGDARLLKFLESQSIPAISLIRRVESDLLDTIIFEDFAGSRAATRHLIQLGHTRIGYIGGDVRYSSNHERWQGFISEMRAESLPTPDSLVKIGTLRDAWGALAARQLLELPDPPTAFFVSSNAVMPGVMKTMHQAGVCIPGDVSLICFDDLDWFSYASPPICAISTSHTRIAEAAVDLLFRRIEDITEQERPPIIERISFELQIRNSTAPPKSSKNRAS
jgi:LacI family transcriptional regulator